MSIFSKLFKSQKQSQETVTDFDATTFKTLKIGTQVWSATNLNVSNFNNGDAIPEAKTVAEWNKASENGKPTWCYYENDPTNGEIYGKLYNWFVVKDPRGLAPKGWHIPSDTEWKTLTDNLGGAGIAGSKLKEVGNIHWKRLNTESNNKSGFTAIPGGARGIGGAFNNIGSSGYWWSSTEYNTGKAWCCFMSFNHSHIEMSDFNESNGLSIRCVKD